MRVAVVHSFYTESQPSGENAVVRDQVAQLSAAGHEVRLISRSTDECRSSVGYHVRSAMTAATGVGASPARLLADFRPDVVHLHNTFPNWGTRWLEAWGRQTVVTVHNYRSVCSNGLLFRDGQACQDCLRTPVVPSLRHRCYRDSRFASLPLAIGSAPGGGLRRVPEMCARVVALNQSSADFFSHLLGKSVDLVPNFVPRGERSPAPSRRWLYVGRLSAEKGIDSLLREWPGGELLDIVGSGPLEPHVRALAADKPGVRVLGLLPRDSILRMLPGYLGLVVPSNCAESLPTVILEALACGVPSVLSSHIEAAAGLAQAGAAVVFRLGEGEATEALDKVERGSGEMRAAAEELYDEQFSPTAWQVSIESIYREVANASSV